MMRIAVLAHIRHPIARPFAGGMEAYSWALAGRLAARGHDVTLFASGDSAADAPAGVAVHPVIERHYDLDYPWHQFHGTDVLNAYLDAAFARVGRDLLDGGFDVIHNNSLHRFPPRLARVADLPMVTSLHVPPFDVLQRAVHQSAAPRARFTVTSRLQKIRWWPDGSPATASVLYNGIDPAAWPFVPRGDGSAVWVGRITPTKGTHLAVSAARQAGIPLTILGAIEHRDYFEQSVRPFLKGGIRYGGHLSGRDLSDTVGRASVLLFTPLWDEPFGLSAIEAMATGLPVAAIDMGAVREVVGEAGFYAAPDDIPGLAAAMTRAMELPRCASRARVEHLFTLDRMVERAEGLYFAAMNAVAYEPVESSFTRRELCILPGEIGLPTFRLPCKVGSTHRSIER